MHFRQAQTYTDSECLIYSSEQSKQTAFTLKYISGTVNIETSASNMRNTLFYILI